MKVPVTLGETSGGKVEVLCGPNDLSLIGQKELLRVMKRNGGKCGKGILDAIAGIEVSKAALNAARKDVGVVRLDALSAERDVAYYSGTGKNPEQAAKAKESLDAAKKDLVKAEKIEADAEKGVAKAEDALAKAEALEKKVYVRGYFFASPDKAPRFHAAPATAAVED